MNPFEIITSTGIEFHEFIIKYLETNLELLKTLGKIQNESYNNYLNTLQLFKTFENCNKVETFLKVLMGFKIVVNKQMIDFNNQDFFVNTSHLTINETNSKIIIKINEGTESFVISNESSPVEFNYNEFIFYKKSISSLLSKCADIMDMQAMFDMPRIQVINKPPSGKFKIDNLNHKDLCDYFETLNSHNEIKIKSCEMIMKYCAFLQKFEENTLECISLYLNLVTNNKNVELTKHFFTNNLVNPKYFKDMICHSFNFKTLDFTAEDTINITNSFKRCLGHQIQIPTNRQPQQQQLRSKNYEMKDSYQKHSHSDYQQTKMPSGVVFQTV